MKDLIYFPSLSSFSTYFKKDIPLINNYSHKFYEDSFGKDAHKFFLLSAGSLYKKKNIRKELGMEDCLVFGDSGGFQIATGALKWDVKLREDIFNWLEANSDIAMNIDIPPVSPDIPFSECIKITVDNMKWFEKHQTGKTDFLNVIQCQTIPQMEEWFAAVKDFKEFKGWGVGNVASFQTYAHLIYLFLKNDMFDDPNFKWFHFLGKTTPAHYIVYALLQKSLNEHFPHVHVTMDSSTPAMQSVFGNWYHSVNWRSLSFAKLYYGNKGRTQYTEDAKLPCAIDCPMCKEINFGNIANDGGASRFYISYHNLFLMNKLLKDVNDLCKGHITLFESLVETDFFKFLKSIYTMFELRGDKLKLDKFYKEHEVLYRDWAIAYNVDSKEKFDDTEVWDAGVPKKKKDADADDIKKLSKKEKADLKKIEQGISLEEED